MDDIREQAKQLKNEGNYKDAIALYRQIWSENSNEWISWEYAYCLNKEDEIDNAIEVLETTNRKHPNFNYAKNLLSWCYYNKYFKNTKEKYSYDEMIELAAISEKIVSLVEQSENTSYEHTVFSLIKILKQGATFPADKILYWLDKISIDITDGAPRYFQLKGQRKEYQSHKEMYFSCKTKALFETKNYDGCIICCDDAFEKVDGFHHNNDIWIKMRKAQCIGLLGNIDEAIKQLLELAKTFEHWKLFIEIARFYHKSGESDLFLLYCYRAALTSDDIKMKVNLVFGIGISLHELGDYENAIKHFMLAYQIRIKNDWNIPQKLSEHLGDINIVTTSEISLDEIKDFWFNEIRRLIGILQGKITFIAPNNKVGFISYNGGSVFFKTSSIYGKKLLSKGQKVSFSLVDSFDKKKNRDTQEAKYITII